MTTELHVTSMGDHEFLVVMAADGESVESEFVIYPDVLDDLGLGGADEEHVVRLTAAFLTERQPIIDVPAMVDLDAVVASYGDYADHLRRALGADRTGTPTG